MRLISKEIKMEFDLGEHDNSISDEPVFTLYKSSDKDSWIGINGTNIALTERDLEDLLSVIRSYFSK